MSEYDRTTGKKWPRGRFLAPRTGLVLLGFLAIVGALLLTEHRAHALGALIWLLPFACLLMHMFLHGGHKVHRHHLRNHPKSEP